MPAWPYRQSSPTRPRVYLLNRGFKLALVVLGLSLGSLGALNAQDESELPLLFQWQGKWHKLSEFDDTQLEDASYEALCAWAAWAVEEEYVGLLSDDHRALIFVSSKRKKRGSTWLKVFSEVEETLAPLFSTEAESPSEQKGSRRSGPGRETASKRAHSPDEEVKQTIVLFEFMKTHEFSSALDHLESSYPATRGIKTAVGEESGFTQWGPYVAGWLEHASGVEQWHPKNELINRSTQLLAMARYGHQPLWMCLGLAWYVEFKLTKRIYCFPYRNEFVAIGEHNGFESALRSMFRKRKNDPLGMNELAAVERGKVSKEQSYICWGFVHYLAKHRPKTFDSIMKTFGKKFRPQSRRGSQSGMSAQEQGDLIREVAGEDVFECASQAFLDGKRYKEPGQ